MSFSTVEDYNALSDAEVLARSRTEPEFFAVLVRRYEAPLLRRARANAIEWPQAVRDVWLLFVPPDKVSERPDFYEQHRQ